MQTRRIRRFSLGIGLLELMLSLAIISLLLIMATRYYQSASENNKRNMAVDMFSAINGAVQTWKIDWGSGTGSTLNLKLLVEGGYLPPSYGSGSNVAPWGGNITILPPSGGTYKITMDNVPASSCSATATRVSGTIGLIGALSDVSGGASTCDGSTITTAYNY